MARLAPGREARGPRWRSGSREVDAHARHRGEGLQRCAVPDGGPRRDPRSVVLLTAEDGIADTVRPRLDAAGADVDRVFVFSGVVDPETGTVREPSLPGDLERIEKIVVENDAALVIVDVLSAFLHGSVDSYRDQDVRGARMPLARLAERTGATVVVLRHLSKSGGANPLYRGGGSIGIIGAARVGLLVVRGENTQLPVTGVGLAASYIDPRSLGALVLVSLELIQDSAVDVGQLVTGDYSQAVLAVRAPLQVLVLKERYIDYGQVGFVAFARCDVSVQRAAAFRARLVGTAT